jgi:succinate dehydrogenase/fumarate reductase flavoprotein subunit
MERTSSEQVQECDVLVVGTGAGGSSAALTARINGLDVLVVEKEQVFGGTTAFSGGWLWIPCNPLAGREGIEDSLDDGRLYLHQDLGNHYDETRIEAFLKNGPEMVEFFDRNTAVKFFVGTAMPDYHGDKPGSVAAGRSICAQPIDGRELGVDIRRLRKQRRELLVFGMALVSGPDLNHFYAAKKSLRSAAYVVKRLVVSLWDRIWHGRDLHLGNGAALAARYLKSLRDREIEIWYSSPVKKLVVEDNRVKGAVVEREGVQVRVLARKGVVLATGGFPNDFERRRKMHPHQPSADQHFSLTPLTNTGDGLRLGEEAGGSVNAAVINTAPWMPVSRVPYPDGTTGTFLSIFDRGKPGMIAVKADGKRFVNESAPYADIVPPMFAGDAPGKGSFAFVIGDHWAVRRYGLGIAKPAPLPIGKYLKSGYILKADTIEELARVAGIDAPVLKQTIERFNENARKGEDPEFGKGSTPYNRYLGDPEHKPNPCVGPLETPPFYAVKIYPGDIGTFAGLRTDEFARVLDTAGKPIPGLYAVGADNGNVFGGGYPGGGSTLGPAATFGYIAGRHLAGIV